MACLEDGGRPLVSSGGIQRERKERGRGRDRQTDRHIQTDRDKDKEGGRLCLALFLKPQSPPPVTPFLSTRPHLLIIRIFLK